MLTLAISSQEHSRPTATIDMPLLRRDPYKPLYVSSGKANALHHTDFIYQQACQVSPYVLPGMHSCTFGHRELANSFIQIKMSDMQEAGRSAAEEK